MNRAYDVVVVGGGPTGSTAARLCAESGLSTLLVEEQAHIGYPVQCAGLLSNSAFAECDVGNSSILNTVSGADIFAGSAVCSFDAGKRMAFVVDRGMLDQEMGFSAADAGADIRLKTIATGISRRSHTLKVKGLYGINEVEYSILIAADGPRSSISRMIGIPRAPMYLSGLQCDVYHPVPTEHVQIFPNAAPDFFAWMIPISDNHTRIGLCGIHHVREHFSAFIKPFQDRCAHFVSGTIPLGTISRSYDDRILIAGDAAAMAKPTSGGGVYTGVRAARHAAQIAISSCEQDFFTARAMSAYERAWKSDFGHEISKGYKIFNIRRNISLPEMERLVQIMSNPKIRRIITSKGDMDRPSHLVSSLLLHPGMLPAWCLLGKAVIRSL